MIKEVQYSDGPNQYHTPTLIRRGGINSVGGVVPQSEIKVLLTERERDRDRAGGGKGFWAGKNSRCPV